MYFMPTNVIQMVVSFIKILHFVWNKHFFTDISAEIATYIWIQILKRPISRWVEYTKNSVFFTTLKI